MPRLGGFETNVSRDPVQRRALVAVSKRSRCGAPWPAPAVRLLQEAVHGSQVVQSLGSLERVAVRTTGKRHPVGSILRSLLSTLGLVMLGLSSCAQRGSKRCKPSACSS